MQLRIVHVCEATLTKRLVEFENTESASLTVCFLFLVILWDRNYDSIVQIISVWNKSDDLWHAHSAAELHLVKINVMCIVNNGESMWCAYFIYFSLLLIKNMLPLSNFSSPLKKEKQIQQWNVFKFYQCCLVAPCDLWIMENQHDVRTLFYFFFTSNKTCCLYQISLHPRER